MQLAKPSLDVGLYTNQTQKMLGFWQQEIGLPCESMQPLGRGVQQHRHAMNGSVLKLNSVREPLPKAAPSGYRELWVADTQVLEPESLRDPDGNAIRLVPSGHAGVNGIALVLQVRSARAFEAFYGRAMRLPEAGKNAYRCGDTLLRFEENPRAVRDAPMQARGLRYFTIQVVDIDREHATLVERGVREAMAPMTLGDVARVSFLRDPDGNWIELSQRASLTGPF